MSLTAVTICFAIALAVWHRSRSNDPYGLFHLALNRLATDDPDDPPKTEWLNMGYWRDAKTFPEACRALALRTIMAANPKEGGVVLDVGHGTGESLLLLLGLSSPSSPPSSIPRPSKIIGITSLPAHHIRSLSRVKQAQATHPPSQRKQVDVELYAGDAVFRPNTQPENEKEKTHPLDPQSPQLYDSIIALDCAYHFGTRRLFLAQSFAKLAPGGGIGLADICFASPPANIFRKLGRSLPIMPSENRITIPEYESQLRQIGYVDVGIEDISQYVFPGFVVFLKSRGWGWWIFACVLDAYVRWGEARFVLVSARKPEIG